MGSSLHFARSARGVANFDVPSKLHSRQLLQGPAPAPLHPQVVLYDLHGDKVTQFACYGRKEGQQVRWARCPAARVLRPPPLPRIRRGRLVP